MGRDENPGLAWSGMARHMTYPGISSVGLQEHNDLHQMEMTGHRITEGSQWLPNATPTTIISHQNTERHPVGGKAASWPPAGCGAGHHPPGG